ncbi:MAG TPA: zf-HC2 domain-containing protein [Chitinophagaceae bacterium]|nr:zf-HC2 domain-containing protein [Chitinophagaceae bacterium]
MELESEPLLPKEKCLDQTELIGYLRQTLQGPEKDRVRMHLEGCALCRDALQGLSRVQPPTRIPALVQEVNRWALKRLERTKLKKKSQKFYILLSLTVFIVLVVVLVAYMAYRSTERRERLRSHPAHGGTAWSNPGPRKNPGLSIIDAGNLFSPVLKDFQGGGLEDANGGNGPLVG